MTMTYSLHKNLKIQFLSKLGYYIKLIKSILTSSPCFFLPLRFPGCLNKANSFFNNDFLFLSFLVEGISHCVLDNCEVNCLLHHCVSHIHGIKTFFFWSVFELFHNKNL